MHIHCYFKLNKKIDIRDATYFDLWTDDKGYHGNYQGCKCNADVIKYCTKDGNYLSNLTADELLAIVKSRKEKKSLIGTLIMNEGGITS